VRDSHGVTRVVGVAKLIRAARVIGAALLIAGCAPEPATDVASEEPESPMIGVDPGLVPKSFSDAAGAPRVALVKMPYHGGRNVPEKSGNPDYLEAGGIADMLEGDGAALKTVATVALSPEDERQYGEWNRLGLANGHLQDIVAANEADNWLTVGLLGNCNSVIGILAGLQGEGSGKRAVGLVFIDAHGDFNTPETTLSGMLGGMPVAVSAGLGLQNLRRTSGLEVPLPTEHIVLGAVRDLDSLEAELIAGTDVRMITTDDIRGLSPEMHAQMRRLSESTDVIYVHIDMDVLDPAEVPGHPLTVADGPTSLELAAALTEMFRYPKVAALGIASTPWGENDPDGVSRQAAYNLIRGAVAGLTARPRPAETGS